MDKKIFIADGQIEKICYSKNKTTILIKRELTSIKLIFEMTLGIKMYSTEGQDLSHLEEKETGVFLSHVCKSTEENIEDFKEYNIISSWSDDPLVQIVARDVTQENF